MYEAVSTDPSDEESLATVLETAATYGYEGIVVRSPSSDAVGRIEPLGEAHSLDVVDGIEIDADSPETASGSVGNVRPDHTVVTVVGGSPTMNRFAVETEKVDVLTRPMAGQGDVNHVMAKAAVENDVRIEFDLGPVVRSSGGRRVRALAALQKLHEIVSYYEAPYVVSVNPGSHLELRAPRELAALGDVIGLSASWIEDGLAEWGRLATKNRRIQSESFIEPGVERGRYETER
ncbi:RNase P subunit p30 family protein [Halovivax gelatinilyticus]|uniref:RNase P subunit p30 family protein n=1 Tax=Halovivax gelatinilyticus TaxID=2961597 RepID=UPI0020CA43E7|nr:RNase P subunit p30 family protein [Halovivax gelatinilyticus]